jgi:hypothetical protein
LWTIWDTEKSLLLGDLPPHVSQPVEEVLVRVPAAVAVGIGDWRLGFLLLLGGGGVLGRGPVRGFVRVVRVQRPRGAVIAVVPGDLGTCCEPGCWHTLSGKLATYTIRRLRV